MTQTTSGIEPVFMPVYKRRRKVNPNDPQTHVDFVDETGDAFEEYIVFHHKFVEWMTVNGYDPTKRYTQEEIDKLVEKSPYYKATSNDVDWLMKVKMQGRIQKWVDHSISVTINLPNDVDEALVNRLYVEAWRSDAKDVPFIVMAPAPEFYFLPKGQERQKKNFPLQTTYGSRSAPQSTGSGSSTFPKQQRKMGCICRLVGWTSIRNLYRSAR